MIAVEPDPAGGTCLPKSHQPVSGGSGGLHHLFELDAEPDITAQCPKSRGR